MQRIEQILHREFLRQKKTLALAESCTGGALSARLTWIPEASQFFLGSLIAYSNDWKERFLNVSAKTMEQYGAVSRETLEEMLRGLFAKTTADLTAAVSGIAGPSGGTAEKPVGTVYIGVAKRGEKPHIERIQVPSQHRGDVIEHSVQVTLSALLRLLTDQTPIFP